MHCLWVYIRRLEDLKFECLIGVQGSFPRKISLIVDLVRYVYLIWCSIWRGKWGLSNASGRLASFRGFVRKLRKVEGRWSRAHRGEGGEGRGGGGVVGDGRGGRWEGDGKGMGRGEEGEGEVEGKGRGGGSGGQWKVEREKEEGERGEI